MLRSLYTAATGMDAQQTKLDVIAHNLANASTTGFKKMRANFQDLLSETIRSSSPTSAQGGSQPTALQVGLGVRTTSTSRSFAQGDMIQTKNPLDVAIAGSGFFRIQRANGDLAYTRDGSFQLDSTGRLVTQLGELLEPSIIPSPRCDQHHNKARRNRAGKAA
jgi:flagellar basal-body rod protein FlgG